MTISSPIAEPVADRRLPFVVHQDLPVGSWLRGAVLVLGNFDGFHLGHRALVDQARRLAGDRPVALMSCEPHPRSFFGDVQQFRLSTPGSKLRMIAPAEIDYIYSPQFDWAFAGRSADEFCRTVLGWALGVAAVVAGEDFRFGRARAGDIAQLAQLGKEVGFDCHVATSVALNGDRISSTRVREALRQGDLRGAEALLGASWLVEVVRGQDGRLQLHPDLCRPASGVCFGRPEGGNPCRVRITESGVFLPVGPPVPGFWHLGASAELST